VLEEVDLKEGKFEIERVGVFSRNKISKRNSLKIKIINYSKKTFGSLRQIVEDKPKTPLPGVNLANTVEIVVSYTFISV
jgi:hypothetical protein